MRSAPRGPEAAGAGKAGSACRRPPEPRPLLSASSRSVPRHAAVPGLGSSTPQPSLGNETPPQGPPPPRPGPRSPAERRSLPYRRQGPPAPGRPGRGTAPHAIPARRPRARPGSAQLSSARALAVLLPTRAPFDSVADGTAIHNVHIHACHGLPPDY